MLRKIIFFCLIPFMMKSCGEKSTTTPLPNIIFLFADDQRYNTINALGNDEIITPNLDKLSSEGVSFMNAYIMGSTSAAVCAPSRAMLMTGKNLFHLSKKGEWNYHIAEKDTTLPEVMRAMGYYTHGTGKQHNGREVFARGFSDGGHIMFGGMSDHYKVPVQDFRYDSLYSGDRQYYAVDKHSTDLYTDDAINFIQSCNEEKPFFLYLSFQAPHDPRDMPEAYLEMYEGKSLDIPPNFMPQHPFDNGELTIRDELLAPFPRTKDEIRDHIRDYYAMITHVDDAVGRILKEVEKRGLLDNTLIIFAGDNGLAVGQHGLMGKQNLYEHSVKIPMIIKGPGVPAGVRSDAFCYLHDLYPALSDYIGFNLPATVETESFYQSLITPGLGHREFMVFAYKDYQRGIRKGKWKLIEYYVDSEHHTQLFNLDEDPYETRNLADFPGNNQKLTELRELMTKEFERLDDDSDFWEWQDNQ